MLWVLRGVGLQITIQTGLFVIFLFHNCKSDFLELLRLLCCLFFLFLFVYGRVFGFNVVPHIIGHAVTFLVGVGVLRAA